MSVIGLRVGPFEIVEPARIPGRGRFYVARRAGMTRKQPTEVLVQLVVPDAAPAARAALQHTFEVLKSLDDPRIPSAVGFYEGLGALATTWPGGAPLRMLVDGRADDTIPMTPTTLLDLLLEIAESLQRAHHRGAAHGHLGPDTVWLARDGSVWMLGWGDADARAPGSWLPPEHARGASTTPTTDQWGLAALAAALITGRSPWPSTDALSAARSGDPTDIVAPVQRQWPALARLLRRMLDPHPANRFESMHPVRQEMLALARKAGGASARREVATELCARWASAPAPLEVDPVSPPDPADEETERYEVPPDVERIIAQRVAAAPEVDPEAPTVDRIVSPVAPPEPEPEPAPTERMPSPTADPEAETVEVHHADLPRVDTEEPTADRTESVSDLLDRIAAQQADVEPSEETVRFHDASIVQRGPESDETVRMSSGAIRDALEEDAVVIDGGAPTAVPATDSAEPHTDPGLTVQPSFARPQAPTPAARPQRRPSPDPPPADGDLTTVQRVLIGGALVAVIVALLAGVVALV